MTDAVSADRCYEPAHYLVIDILVRRPERCELGVCLYRHTQSERRRHLITVFEREAVGIDLDEVEFYIIHYEVEHGFGVIVARDLALECPLIVFREYVIPAVVCERFDNAAGKLAVRSGRDRECGRSC